MSLDYTVYTTLTDEARLAYTKLIDDGSVNFQIYGFAFGSGGIDAEGSATAVSSSDTTLENQIYPSDGILPLQSIEVPNDVTVAAVCNIPLNEGPFSLGELGIFAKYTKYDEDPTKLGTKFLYAICHFPITIKLQTDILIKRVIISF